MRAHGAIGPQRWRPFGSSAVWKVESAEGCSRTRPRTRCGSGTLRSSMSTTSVSPVHSTALRPTAKARASRRTWRCPRSVIVQRRTGPYRQTLIAQWSSAGVPASRANARR